MLKSVSPQITYNIFETFYPPSPPKGKRTKELEMSFRNKSLMSQCAVTTFDKDLLRNWQMSTFSSFLQNLHPTQRTAMCLKETDLSHQNSYVAWKDDIPTKDEQRNWEQKFPLNVTKEVKNDPSQSYFTRKRYTRDPIWICGLYIRPPQAYVDNK